MDEATLESRLKVLWEQHRDAARERVALIADAAVALLGDELTPELREEAEHASHKLAGSLGTFGRPQGTQAAQELEQLFSEPASLSDAPRAAELTEQLRRIVESEA